MVLLACGRRPLRGCRAHRSVRELCWGTVLLLVDANDTTKQTVAAGLLHHSIPQRCRGPPLWVSARLWILWLCGKCSSPPVCANILLRDIYVCAWTASPCAWTVLQVFPCCCAICLSKDSQWRSWYCCWWWWCCFRCPWVCTQEGWKASPKMCAISCVGR